MKLWAMYYIGIAYINYKTDLQNSILENAHSASTI